MDEKKKYWQSSSNIHNVPLREELQYTSILEKRSSGTTASHIMTEHFRWIYATADVVSCSFAVLPLLLSISQNCAISVECCGGQEFSMACVSSLSFLLSTAADFVQGEHQALMMYRPSLMSPQAPWYLTLPSLPFIKSKIQRRPPTPSQTVDKNTILVINFVWAPIYLVLMKPQVSDYLITQTTYSNFFLFLDSYCNWRHFLLTVGQYRVNAENSRKFKIFKMIWDML